MADFPNDRQVSTFIVEPSINYMVEITHDNGARQVEYSDNLSLADDLEEWLSPTMSRIVIVRN